ncbi:MAG: hypothetical protein EKK55_24505 [Rhodocyclaceae bacterium]|nr:MAG: hypothetical protein EKK55_24505 [Rhodocyclaceae bacterium]
MDIDRAVRSVRQIAPVFTPWFTPLHPESDEGAVFLGHLLVIRYDEGVIEVEAQDLFVTPKGEYLRRWGDAEPDYGSFGDAAPPGSAYAFIAKLAGERKAAPEAFVPCAWYITA